MDFGNHAGFILASYGLSILVVVGLFAWVVIDGRAQRRRLAELEARGVHRRSQGQSQSQSRGQPQSMGMSRSAQPTTGDAR